MEKIKGVIFLIESLLNTSKRSLFSKNIVLPANDMFALISKLKDAVQAVEEDISIHTSLQTETLENGRGDINQPIVDAKKEVFKLKKEANDYADSVLSRLQLAITKLQQNVIKMEKNIVEGRNLIQQKKIQQMKGESDEA